jgi:colanic acid/amylovoran biosynthesis glycosyltransferase
VSFPQVAIFRQELLPMSETFILDQAMALRGFAPQFVGLTRVARSLPLPGTPAVLTEIEQPFSSLHLRAYRRGLPASRFFHNVASGGPALVHAHFAPDGVAAMPLAAYLKIPLIVTLHGYDITVCSRRFRRNPLERAFYRQRLRQLWQQAELFICISEFIRQRALAAGFPENKLRMHYTGIDARKFRPRDISREPGLIVFVGRLVEKKGCAFLLEALRRLRGHVPDLHAVIIGEGNLRGDLERKAEELSLPVVFLGSQNSDVVRSWLARAQIFCVPSVTAADGDSEGFGMVFAEAQAMGTPVISFRHGGIPEAVADGETGILLKEGDAAGLASAIELLLCNPQEWARLGRAGIAHVASRFDLAARTAELEEIYREVIGRHTSLHRRRIA